MVFIENLKVGDKVAWPFLCRTKSLQVTRNGNDYLAVVLQDKTKSIDAKVWDIEMCVDGNFEAGDFVFVQGTVTTYKDNLQIKVEYIRLASPDEYVEEDFLPVSRKNIDTMYAQLLTYVKKIENPKMRALVDSFFVNDPQFIEMFKRHSAAKSNHHGFIGGLLEHTLDVTVLCWCYCVLYPQLNKDLLLAAALFHDIGKVRELSAFPTNDYTDEGELLGHIVIGYEMVKDRIRTIPDFPEKTERELLHCILAHHGELEYGSPKKPELMEASALSFADNTDAKMETFIEQVVGATSDDWLGNNRVLDANVRKTTPLEGIASE